MNDEVEVQPVSVMKRNGKKYNKLLKSQAIRAHLNSAKFADVSNGNRPLEPKASKVEFLKSERGFTDEEIKIYRQPDHGRFEAL